MVCSSSLIVLLLSTNIIVVVQAHEEYKWEVPNGSYLAIGDNRDNSLDSRAWGYFSEDYLVGKADFIWMHWSSYSSLPTFSRNTRIQ